MKSYEIMTSGIPAVVRIYSVNKKTTPSNTIDSIVSGGNFFDSHCIYTKTSENEVTVP